ncbi:MAG TPA: DUF2089 domain-containing protein [Jiangellales bacterium]|nr:DUF2089 domain-containing protein [Jiangellales bacterium]
MNGHQHTAPRDCPVCGERLAVTRLGCPGCGSELSGRFAACPYCGLGEADRELLRVFLVSRGNMKDLERFLGVSYPTARQRFADLLARLGFETPAGAADAPAPVDREDVLRRLAAGELGVDDAAGLLGGQRG